nr:MAG TPA: hypothetical protein [Microviridae sp.]
MESTRLQLAVVAGDSKIEGENFLPFFYAFTKLNFGSIRGYYSHYFIVLI